ncbi:mannose-6-phosphate isomerase, class I [Psychromicrobium lacuslunae]|uniref:mannose-6-phosphate isomerase n=1 Tax=Psychromicrobium lacuslunae TaxID=1618207 RepID=A0A0D4BWB4_9MICC|nr:mannose-6-phosphate isomerase, class I [Psychromicrobium lacuslunae]AJT40416.1 mannose-6-phosphate isomerase [Psychromicrobium lacuslunae]
MYKLSNTIRPYPWGSLNAIAGLLGRKPSGGPEAELWIGAHLGAPSMVLSEGHSVPLNELIDQDPEQTLGTDSRAAFGDRLPFLLKVLAADKALSLQVHPTLAQAAEGFQAEDAAGIPRDAENRNYKDDNHKPEMIFALTPFDALCGFRPVTETLAIFRHLAERSDSDSGGFPALLSQVINCLLNTDSSAALRDAFELLINGAETTTAAVNWSVTLLRSGVSKQPFEREFDTLLELNEQFPGDPGVLISLLLNRVKLSPGECLSMPAGNVHAYLNGLGIEVMASSDNVLRGGLTTKFVDIPELLRIVDFHELPAPEVTASSTALGQELYIPGFNEFQLQRITIQAGTEPVPLAQHGPVLVLITEGAAFLDSPRGDLALAHGESAFIAAAESPVLLHSQQGCTAFAVTTALSSTV